MANEKQLAVDFTIISSPSYIHLECPFCEEEVEISWAKLKVPQSWCDKWEDVKCPLCGKMISLGDWKYD